MKNKKATIGYSADENCNRDDCVGIIKQQRAMAMISIKEGDPQPLNCPKCKLKEGYIVSKVVQVTSGDMFDSDGNYVTQIDSEYRKPIRTLIKCHCSNCTTHLPFKVMQ